MGKYSAKLHGKNDFAEVSKNLARYRSKNKNRQNNYVGRSSWSNVKTCLQHFHQRLSVLHNYIVFRSVSS